MSTRANVIITDGDDTLIFYRHSDGYPDCTGADLLEFVEGYQDRSMRNNATQSAGWLIVRGAFEYANQKTHTPVKTAALNGHISGFEFRNEWKVGAYEPAARLSSDVEFIYVIDLKAYTLTTLTPKSAFWDSPSLKNCKRISVDEFAPAEDAVTA